MSKYYKALLVSSLFLLGGVSNAVLPGTSDDVEEGAAAAIPVAGAAAALSGEDSIADVVAARQAHIVLRQNRRSQVSMIAALRAPQTPWSPIHCTDFSADTDKLLHHFGVRSTGCHVQMAECSYIGQKHFGDPRPNAYDPPEDLRLSMRAFHLLWTEGNKETSLPELFKTNLRSVRTLDLSCSGISHISDGVFDALPNLEKVNLIGNFIEHDLQRLFSRNERLTEVLTTTRQQTNFPWGDKRVLSHLL